MPIIMKSGNFAISTMFYKTVRYYGFVYYFPIPNNIDHNVDTALIVLQF